MMTKKRQAIEKSNTGFNSEKPNNCYFYKIIVSALAQKSKLRIPSEFVKKYGEELSDEIYLNVPNSEQPWKVEIQKENNDMFLRKGWQVFMEFYSLEYGHFLVFRLDGGLQSHFHVLIFGMSGTEIDYPPVPKRSTNDCRQLNKDVTDDQEADDDEISPILNTIDARLDSADDEQDLSFKTEEEVLAADEKSVTEYLEAFKSQKPHFKMIMHHSYVSKPYRMSFPIRHVRRHLKPLEVQQIHLKAENHEKSYPVRLNLYHQNSQAAAGFGWKKFVLHNDLQAGDGCVFELVCPQSNAYKVTIFRVATA